MGDPMGFLKYKRDIEKRRLPLERIKDWDELNIDISEDEYRIQAARCMDCGTPFCHSGIMLNGVVSGCPINNLMPEWNDLIHRGLWKKALKRLLITNNFPEFTGRVCPAPCEGACVAGLPSQQVAIKNNELYIIEKAFREGWVRPCPPASRTGKKVAVVGSGPAGLACADQLNKSGHSVTVFERSDRPGGILTYGIPNMKLDKKIVSRRIEIMKKEDVEFVLSTEVGVDYAHDKLLSEFDAVVLCCGATNPRDLKVDGRNLSGIYMAMEFLSANTKSLLDSSLHDGNYISAKDKAVIIIGGGDTGTDCVATAIRHGCKSITQFEILKKPPTMRSDNNPWPEMPSVYKKDYGQSEYQAAFGHDPREYCVMTKRFIGDAEDCLKEVQTVDVKWEVNFDGVKVPIEIPGSERIWKADLVLLCMGFEGPEENLINQFKIIRDKKSNLLAEYGKFSTNVNGVFVAGDMRRGQSLVVWAINEGRGAAKQCDTYLSYLS